MYIPPRIPKPDHHTPTPTREPAPKPTHKPAPGSAVEHMPELIADLRDALKKVVGQTPPAAVEAVEAPPPGVPIPMVALGETAVQQMLLAKLGDKTRT